MLHGGHLIILRSYRRCRSVMRHNGLQICVRFSGNLRLCIYLLNFKRMRGIRREQRNLIRQSVSHEGKPEFYTGIDCQFPEVILVELIGCRTSIHPKISHITESAV